MSLSILFLRPSWALACSPTRMTSRVASWMGMSERWSPLPISSSNLSTRGDPRNIKEQDSGTWIIWPFNSITWQTVQSMRREGVNSERSGLFSSFFMGTEWKCYILHYIDSSLLKCWCQRGNQRKKTSDYMEKTVAIAMFTYTVILITSASLLCHKWHLRKRRAGQLLWTNLMLR